MDKDDIIKLAREAGFERLGTYASFGEDWVAFTESLEAFAALVAKHEREACAAMFDNHNVLDEEVGERIRARGEKA